MKRVLIIDDDPDVRTVVSAFLEKNGFEVDTASYKDEALEKVGQNKPHVILLDVLLSGTDGRTFCQELKGNEDSRHIPIIMFSAHPGAAESIKECGADDFIPKPFSVQALLSLVQKQIEIKN